MSVKVELEFKSVDEAIVALGKLVEAGKPAKPAGVPAGVPAAATAPAAAAPVSTTPKRGPGRPPKDAKGTDAGGSASSAATGGAPAAQAVVGVGGGDPVTLKSSPAVQTAAASAPAAPIAAPSVAATPQSNAKVDVSPQVLPTADDVQKAVEVLFTAKGYDTTLALLKGKYGVSRGKDVDPAQRANFIREANEAAQAKS